MYENRASRKIIPVRRVSFPKVIPHATITIVEIMTNGISTFTVAGFTLRVVMIEVIPRITSTFIILLPITFPIEIPLLPATAALRLTAASGALVPIATMVSPITSSGTPNFLATAAAPSTKKSAPFMSIIKPIIILAMLTNILNK